MFNIFSVFHTIYISTYPCAWCCTNSCTSPESAHLIHYFFWSLPLLCAQRYFASAVRNMLHISGPLTMLLIQAKRQGMSDITANIMSLFFRAMISFVFPISSYQVEYNQRNIYWIHFGYFSSVAVPTGIQKPSPYCLISTVCKNIQKEALQY